MSEGVVISLVRIFDKHISASKQRTQNVRVVKHIILQPALIISNP